MKISVFLLAAFLVSTGSPISKTVAAEVYLVAGQSNAWRMGCIAEGPKILAANPPPKIYYFPMGCGTRPSQAKLQVITSLHPSVYGLELARRLRERAGREIVLVQYAVCGTSLHLPINWFPGDDPAAGQLNDSGLYASFLKYVADARQQVEAQGVKWELKGLFWHQGEADSVPGHCGDYEKNLRRLFIRFRMDFGADLPIVTGRIREIKPEAVTVNRGIDAVASSERRVSVVATDDLPAEAPADWHFATSGCHTLGKRFAEAMGILNQGLTSGAETSRRERD